MADLYAPKHHDSDGQESSSCLLANYVDLLQLYTYRDVFDAKVGGPATIK